MRDPKMVRLRDVYRVREVLAAIRTTPTPEPTPYAPGTPLVVTGDGNLVPRGSAVMMRSDQGDGLYRVWTPVGGEFSVPVDHLAPSLLEPEPHNPNDAEDCDACAESDDICLYHRGVNAGIQMAVKALTRWAEGDED